MCLAIPGKVVSIKNDTAIVGYGPKKVKAKIENKKPKVGDYVILAAEYVIEILDKEQAEKMIQAWKEV
jgi:hydrogenase assembly chaperone HypC/HupF